MNSHGTQVTTSANYADRRRGAEPVRRAQRRPAPSGTLTRIIIWSHSWDVTKGTASGLVVRSSPGGSILQLRDDAEGRRRLAGICPSSSEHEPAGGRSLMPWRTASARPPDIRLRLRIGRYGHHQPDGGGGWNEGIAGMGYLRRLRAGSSRWRGASPARVRDADPCWQSELVAKPCCPGRDESPIFYGWTSQFWRQEYVLLENDRTSTWPHQGLVLGLYQTNSGQTSTLPGRHEHGELRTSRGSC